MRNLFFSFFIIILLSNCSISRNFTSGVHRTYDEVKQQKIAVYKINLPARSIWKKRNAYLVDLVFEQKKSTAETLNLLKMYLRLPIDKKVQDSIYFLSGQMIIPVKIQSAEYILKEGINSHTENEIIKAKDSSRNDILSTDSHLEHYRYYLTKIKTQLPDKLMEQIRLNKQLRIRLYIDEEAYDLTLRKFYIKKIRKVYGLD